MILKGKPLKLLHQDYTKFESIPMGLLAPCVVMFESLIEIMMIMQPVKIAVRGSNVPT